MKTKNKVIITISVIVSLIAGASILAISYINTNPKAEAECSAEAGWLPCWSCGKSYCNPYYRCSKCDLRECECTYPDCDVKRCPVCKKEENCICWKTCIFCGDLECGVAWPCVWCDNLMCMCECVDK